MEFVLISFTKPDGCVGTALIEKEEFDASDGPEDFVVPGTTDVEEHGEVTIEGANTHMLDNFYDSQ